jgi:dienelactone hydrolase
MAQNPRRRRKAALLIVAMTALLFVSCAAYLLRDPLPHFLARRSALASVTEGEPERVDGSIIMPVRLTARSGLSVELAVRRAVQDSGRRLPLAVILGGHYTGKAAVKLLDDMPGVAIVAISYPYDGEPRPDALTFIKNIPRIRQAFFDTPPAISVALDYLLSRPDVDSTSVEGVGVSLGAPFMVIAGALDPRITRVWSVHGSGGSYAPLEVSMRRTIKFAPLRAVAAGLSTMIINGPDMDPVNWAGRISPRPFIMINAGDDERLPRENVEALYQSARHPKEIIWMEGRHVRARREVVKQLVDIVVQRMKQ